MGRMPVTLKVTKFGENQLNCHSDILQTPSGEPICPTPSPNRVKLFEIFWSTPENKRKSSNLQAIADRWGSCSGILDSFIFTCETWKVNVSFNHPIGQFYNDASSIRQTREVNNQKVNRAESGKYTVRKTESVCQWQSG